MSQFFHSSCFLLFPPTISLNLCLFQMCFPHLLLIFQILFQFLLLISIPATSIDSSSSSIPVNPSIRQPTRIRRSPAYLKDYHCQLVCVPFGKTSTSTSSGSPVVGKPSDISPSLAYTKLSLAHRHFVLNVSTVTEPSSYKEAANILLGKMPCPKK